MKYVLFLSSFGLFALNFSPQALEHKAEVEGYGYKTANLIELQGLFKNSSHIRVPEFIGISSPAIQSLLVEYGLELSNTWNQVIANQTLGEALATKVLPSHFLDRNLELAEQIKTLFTSFSHANLKDLQAFLNKAKQNHWRLMVRSTGKEDTDKLANAGGNLSVGNVSPDMPAVLKAMGQVVASYFEERSLAQRLSAGDQTLFNLPLTPVLIQRMIGEELNGASETRKIPVGCVLYTEETAARLTSIYTLQCAYGHNEGVVESLVPLDTYYIQQSGQIQSVIKPKTKRIVPMLEHYVFGLEEINNPAEIQNQTALDKQAINLVSKAGSLIDAYYQKRMDIELVYEPWTQIVYIVQARPLVIPISQEQPSYLTQVSAFNDTEVLRLISINPGNSSVVRIQTRNQIIMAQSLEAALQIYTSPSFDRPAVKAIVVADQADPTSHAAAVFRGDSKLIFVTEQLSQLQTWLKNNSPKLMIDTQRGLVLNTQSQAWAEQDLRDLFEKRILKSGWLNYPLPLRVSVGAHQPEYCLAPQMKPETFFGEVTCLTNRLEDQVRDLNTLTQKTRVDANCDFNQLGCLEQKALAVQTLPKLENLNTHAETLMQQIKSNPNYDLPELLDLFPKRFLESLVAQPAKSNLADAYSVFSVQVEYAEGRRFIDNTLMPLIKAHIVSENILRDPDLFRVAQLGTEASLTEQTTQRFLKFISNTQDRIKLISLIDNLNALQILPMWLNGLFMESTAEINSLDAEYQNSKAYLETLQDKKAQMTSYDLSKWSNAKKFAKTRADFQKKFENYFTSERFLGFNSSLQAIAAVSTMEQYVELFDQSIKMLKSRTDDSRVEQLKIRVQDYLDLFKVWAPRTPEKLIQYHGNWPLSTYLQQVQSLLSSKTQLNDADLLPSRLFSVQAAALGAVTEFDRHFPEHLEDFFTLIHQSINTCIAAWNRQILHNLILPPAFEQAWKKLNQSKEFPVFLTGIQISNGFIAYSINLPLRNHSAKLGLDYRAETGNVNLSFYFLGDARERWSLIRDYALFESDLYRVLMSHVVQNLNDLRFTLESINLSPELQIGDFKNDLSRITLDTKDLLAQIEKNYPLSALKSWILKHEAMGLGNLLPESETEFHLLLANQGIQSLSPLNQSDALKMFSQLVRKKIGIQEAMNALQKFSMTSDTHLQIAAMILAQELLPVVKDSQERYQTTLNTIIAQMAQHYFQNSDSLGKGLALSLYCSIVFEKQYRNAALQAAEFASSDKNPMVIMNNLRLFSALIPYHLGMKSALKLATENVENPNQHIAYQAKELLKEVWNLAAKHAINGA